MLQNYLSSKNDVPKQGFYQTLQLHIFTLWASLVDHSDDKEWACNAGDPGLIPGLGRGPGEGNGYLPQFSFLENPKGREAWWVNVHGVTKSWTRLSEWKQQCWERLKEKEKGVAGGEMIRWLDSITDSRDLNLSKLQDIAEDRGDVCCSSWGGKEPDRTYWLKSNFYII